MLKLFCCDSGQYLYGTVAKKAQFKLKHKSIYVVAMMVNKNPAEKKPTWLAGFSASIVNDSELVNLVVICRTSTIIT